MTPWTTLVPGSPRIAVASAGRGPLVLFLHGIGGNRNHWQHQLAFFSQSGFKAAAWDARGYGDSDDYEGALQFEDFTSDLLRTVDFLNEERVHLVGLSMGGRVARNFALAHPGRLRTLTLANTSPGFDALTPEEVLRFVEEREHRSAESAASNAARQWALSVSTPTKGSTDEAQRVSSVELSGGSRRDSGGNSETASSHLLKGSRHILGPGGRKTIGGAADRRCG